MRIKLISLDYSEFEDNPQKDSWSLKGLIFDEFNLIVGKNAVGKSRTLRVIYNLSSMLAKRSPLVDGHFKVSFDIENGGYKKMSYELNILNKKILKEYVKVDEKIVLKRNGKTKIYSYKAKKDIDIDPPVDELVLSVRRDQSEFPFFEHLVSWATNIVYYKFADTSANVIELPRHGITQGMFSLQALPSIFSELSEKSVKQIIEDFNSIGYQVSNARTNIAPGALIGLKILQIREKNFKDFIDQPNISQGMFRAFALLSVIQHYIDIGSSLTILVDDLCEGLDYERAEKFTKLLYRKITGKNIQFIATTNDITLMNWIDLEHWNILSRVVGDVSAYNYSNSKKAFDAFKLTGLTNFDIFSSNLLSKLKDEEKN